MSPMFEHSGDPLRIGAAQQRAHAGEQFRHRERLDDVVVGAGSEPAHLLALLAARGEHDDRQLAGFRPRAQPAAQLDAGQARQHPVEHHQVGAALLQPSIGLVAARGGLNLVALGLEIVAEQHGERLFVLHDQDARVHGFVPWRIRYLSPARSAAMVVVSPFGLCSVIGRPSMT